MYLKDVFSKNMFYPHQLLKIYHFYHPIKHFGVYVFSSSEVLKKWKVLHVECGTNVYIVLTILSLEVFNFV